jgi:hypothetical protein
VAWCHLHPQVFMENLLTVMRPVDGTLRWPMGDKRVEWVAGDDIAAVAAKVLAEGPETWVKLSGAYADTKMGPPTYSESSAIARAYGRRGSFAPAAAAARSTWW